MSKMAVGKKRQSDSAPAQVSKKVKIQNGATYGSKPAVKKHFDEEEQDDFEGLDEEEAMEDEAIQETGQDKIHPSRQTAHQQIPNGNAGTANGKSM